MNNLQGLLKHGNVIGDPLFQLDKADFLENKKLPYTIPFSVAMDKLTENTSSVSEQDINQFILSQIPDYHEKQWDDVRKQQIYLQAENHLKNKKYHAATFEMYQLQGTPSSILIDKNGILRQVSFGAVNKLEPEILRLLKE